MNVALRRRFKAAVAVAAVTGAATAMVAPHASAETLLIESFRNDDVANSAAWSSGGSGDSEPGWPGGACLTAGTNSEQSPIPGCALASPDAPGSGVLRLTPNSVSTAGFALYNEALPTTGGLDITFMQSQWGAEGQAADGLAFFLVDGSTNLTEPGLAGGGLGYSAGWYGGSTDGPGIDKWGNFSDPGATGSGCASGSGVGSAGPGQTPNVVAIRGPGNGSAGYCWLGASAALGNILYGDNTRAGAAVEVHVVIDPSTTTDPQVTVYMNDVEVLKMDQPAELLESTSFKFGFSGATGTITDVHEVWGLEIESVIPVPPSTTTTTTTTTTEPSNGSTSTTTPGSPTPATPATPVAAGDLDYTG